MEYKIPQIEKYEQEKKEETYLNKNIYEASDFYLPSYLNLINKIEKNEAWKKELEEKHGLINSDLKYQAYLIMNMEKRFNSLQRQYSFLQLNFNHRLEEVIKYSIMRNRDFLVSFFMIIIGVSLFSIGMMMQFNAFMRIGAIAFFVVVWDMLIRQRQIR
jgi:hypothetical protein